MTPTQQRLDAIERANVMRARRRELRRQIRAGERTLLDVLSGPDPDVSDLALVEILAMARSTGLRSMGLAQIGEDAMHARVNLLLPAGRASERQRLWAARVGSRQLRRQT